MTNKNDVLKNERSPAFDTHRFLATVGVGRTLVKFRKDEKIFSQGQASDAAFYIHKGRVKVTVTSIGGKEGVVAILEPDEFFGESCLTGQQRRLSSARAIAECEIMRIDKAAMINAIQNAPTFSLMVIQHVLMFHLSVLSFTKNSK